MNNINVNKIIYLVSTLADEKLVAALQDFHETDILLAMQELDEDSVARLKRILPIDMLSDMASNIDDSEEMEDLARDIDNEKLADIIEDMDTQDAIDLLEALPEEQQALVLDLVDEDVKEEISEVDSYEEDEVGSYMDKDYLVVNDALTVKKAMRIVIQAASEIDDFSIIYVNDEDNKYRGLILLKDLICARGDDSFVDLIKENYPKLNHKTNIEEKIDEISEYELESYPVINDKNELIGVIKADTIKELVEISAKEDFNMLASISDDYLSEKLTKSVFHRIPWLLFLLVVSILVCFVASSFEELVAPFVTILFFQSMVLDMSGNVGTQSLAVMIASQEDIKGKFKEALKTILKEVLIGLINGVVLGIISFLIVFLFLQITGKDMNLTIKSALSIGTAILIVPTISSFIGTVVPLILIKLHVDPAVASGPFITTLNDITAVLLYYGLAILIFTIL